MPPLNEPDVVLILTRRDLEVALKDDPETDLVDLVGAAYMVHARGQTALPHSTFLHFPDQPHNRIIALPAFLGDRFAVAGVKWISSFPDNVAQGLERASAMIVLNSLATGRPRLVMEGALISAMRTAASAALAARELHTNRTPVIGLVGAGRINLEVTRFLSAVFPRAQSWRIFDLNAARAADFETRLASLRPGLAIRPESNLTRLLRECDLTCFATTAATPHVTDLSPCPSGATLLHVSLRDLSAEALLTADNVVDDVDHVCRAQTSPHLAEQLVGHRRFIRAELGAILCAQAEARPDPRGLTVFSPFGLGILDLAVAARAGERAAQLGVGTLVRDFHGDY